MTAKTDFSRAGAKRGAWLASLAAASLAFPAVALAAEETKSDTIGPWEIEATFKGDKLDRCAINRRLDNEIVATFVRSGDDIALELGIAELEARSRAEIPGEDDARAAQLRHRGRRRSPTRYRWM